MFWEGKACASTWIEYVSQCTANKLMHGVRSCTAENHS